MVNPQYGYTKTELSKVGDTLSKLFASMQGADASYACSASSNLLIVTSNSNYLAEIEKLIEEIAISHPARFFVLFPDSTCPSMYAEVSARCHGLSKTEHVCSEVIRIASPSADLEGIASLVRANLLTGLSTELFIFDPKVSKSAIHSLSALAESILVDGCDFGGRLSEIEKISSLVKYFFDFAWVGLGGWRDEVKGVFSKPAANRLLAHLCCIQVNANSSKESLYSASGLLFAGWILDRLGVEEVQMHSPDRMLCHSSTRGNFDLQICLAELPRDGLISRVFFEFHEFTNVYTVELVRAKLLESNVGLEHSYRTSRPLEDESKFGRIKRQFLIGESAANYPGALKQAVRLESLLK